MTSYLPDMLILAALVAASTLVCPPLYGAQTLWRRTDTRYILVGEMHGTVQAPQVFGDLVCNAASASGRPVIVGLESPDVGQPAIDRFLSSDGGANARSEFMRSVIWTSPFKDGRSSAAYFKLYQRLRTMKTHGYITNVIAFQPTGEARTETALNAEMAKRLEAASLRERGSLLIALMGNLHARKRPIRLGSETIIPAAADLPEAQTISLNVPIAGEAWNCLTETDCGPHRESGDVKQQRRVTLIPRPASAFDGEIELGLPTTASPPAVASPSPGVG